MFMLVDIALENILVRVVMSEAILVSPILGSFSVIEFIMSMGANNFENFLISYFIETGLQVAGKIYIEPAVEKLEHYS